MRWREQVMFEQPTTAAENAQQAGAGAAMAERQPEAAVATAGTEQQPAAVSEPPAPAKPRQQRAKPRQVTAANLEAGIRWPSPEESPPFWDRPPRDSPLSLGEFLPAAPPLSTAKVTSISSNAALRQLRRRAIQHCILQPVRRMAAEWVEPMLLAVMVSTALHCPRHAGRTLSAPSLICRRRPPSSRAGFPAAAHRALHRGDGTHCQGASVLHTASTKPADMAMPVLLLRQDGVAVLRSATCRFWIAGELLCGSSNPSQTQKQYVIRRHAGGRPGG